MNRLPLLFALAAAALALGPLPTEPACCYFSAMGQDVNQPAQKAFITWDPEEDIVSWTVQPRFEGNALDFGMVVPSPSRPKLTEMPRDLFKELAVFTILKPMDLSKYKPFPLARGAGFGGAPGGQDLQRKVRVLEAGVVGSLDYKILEAEKADALHAWLKENGYKYSGDEATLDHYLKKKWTFTVMKIDPKQMKKNPDGTYAGEVTPTRFTFSSKVPVYPIRITRISVKQTTEALFYFLGKNKADLSGDWSHRYNFIPMWAQAMSFAVPEKITPDEKAWLDHVKPHLDFLRRKTLELQQNRNFQPTRLEYARRLTAEDMGVLDGTVKYDREADKEAIENLKILKGHLRTGLYLTKCRRIFHKDEMTDDLVFVDSTFEGKPDTMEYERILPTSPP